MRLSKAKKDLMQKKIDNYLPPTLVPSDIIILLNYAWKHSFARVEGNKKAIYERGWCPYNRNLLLKPELVATMTKQEQDAAISLKYVAPKKNLFPENISTFSPEFLSRSITNDDVSHTLNFSSGVASFCAESLISHQQLMERKEEMKSKKTVSEELKEAFKEGKRLSAGLAFKANTCRLGKTILELKKEREKEVQQNADAVGRRQFENYRKKKEKATKIMEKNTVLSSWKKTHFKSVNVHLKRKGDEPVAKELPELLQQYNRWKHRADLRLEDFVSGATMDVANRDGVDDDNNDDGSEMVDLNDVGIL